MKQSTKNFLFFAGGVAVGVALPVIIPAVIEGGRPLAKALLKHGTLAAQRVQVAVARAAEWVEDLFAEVRSDSSPAAQSGPSAAESVPAPMHEVQLQDKKVLS